MSKCWTMSFRKSKIIGSSLKIIFNFAVKRGRGENYFWKRFIKCIKLIDINLER